MIFDWMRLKYNRRRRHMNTYDSTRLLSLLSPRCLRPRSFSFSLRLVSLSLFRSLCVCLLMPDFFSNFEFLPVCDAQPRAPKMTARENKDLQIQIPDCDRGVWSMTTRTRYGEQRHKLRGRSSTTQHPYCGCSPFVGTDSSGWAYSTREERMIAYF